MTTVRGSCACRALEYELTLPTRFVSHCHCENCRRAHGAGFVTWAGVPSARFRWVSETGTLRAWDTPTGSRREFCTVCGTTLTYAGPKWAGEVHVVVASLDGPVDKLPQGHAFADEAPDWCPITDELPR